MLTGGGALLVNNRQVHDTFDSAQAQSRVCACICTCMYEFTRASRILSQWTIMYDSFFSFSFLFSFLFVLYLPVCVYKDVAQ